jgi:hypothetical protein
MRKNFFLSILLVLWCMAVMLSCSNKKPEPSFDEASKAAFDSLAGYGSGGTAADPIASDSVPTDAVPSNPSSASNGGDGGRNAAANPYEEGYDQGYDDGYDDGENGYDREASYDDDTHYRGHAADLYQEGYEEGYNEGYEDGVDDQRVDDEVRYAQ